MFFGLYVFYQLYSLVSGNFPDNVWQPDSFVMAHEGDYVILSCFHPKQEINKVLWYKQPIGQKPLLVTSSYHQALPFYLHNDFDKTGRFNLLRATDSTNLTITKLKPLDAAVYYCASSSSHVVTFGAGTVLALKGNVADKYTVVQQNTPLHMLSSGDSTTLQCSVLSNNCAGEHSLYWFRQGSGESHPGIIYSHKGSSDQCNKSSDTDSPTQSCVYNLRMTNLSTSDAGTYYCAVAMCGEILFGNGAKVTFEDELKIQLIHVMTGLAVCLLISLIINFVLCSTCIKKDRSSNHISAPDKDAGLRAQNQMSDEMNYAALTFATKSTRVRKVKHHEETLYSGLRCESQI